MVSACFVMPNVYMKVGVEGNRVSYFHSKITIEKQVNIMILTITAPVFQGEILGMLVYVSFNVFTPVVICIVF